MSELKMQSELTTSKRKHIARHTPLPHPPKKYSSTEAEPPGRDPGA